MKVTIECTEKQMSTMISCLELVFRLKMGQTSDLADELARDTNFYDKENDKVFDRFLHRRDAIESCLKAVVDIAYGQYSTEVSKDCRVTSDMWSVLRYEYFMSKHKDEDIEGLYTWSSTPINLGTEPMMKVNIELDELEKVEDGTKNAD